MCESGLPLCGWSRSLPTAQLLCCPVTDWNVSTATKQLSFSVLLLILDWCYLVEATTGCQQGALLGRSNVITFDSVTDVLNGERSISSAVPSSFIFTSRHSFLGLRSIP